MAAVYYSNNGVMDLQPDTLEALRKLPSPWMVIVNVRPVSQFTARELDAVVITRRAVHVLEFKRSYAPIHIVSESRWLRGGQEMRGGTGSESPAEQVLNSSAQFKTVLAHKFPRMAEVVRPWVALERFNPHNKIGTPQKPMNPKYWHDDGFAKVIHGLEHLGMVLENREKGMPETLSASDAEHLRRFLGAKPLGQLTVQGHALLLDSRQRLGHARLRLTTTVTGAVFEATTNGEGAFELQGLPLEPVEVTVPDFPELRVLPGATFKANTELLLMHVFLLTPQVSEDRVHELLQEELGRVTGDVEAVLDLTRDSAQKLAQLEADVASTRQAVETLLNSPGIDDNPVLLSTVESLVGRVEALERERRQVEAVSFIPADVVRQDALAPLHSELHALKSRVSQLEGKVTRVGQVAAKAGRDARQAAQQVRGLFGRVDDVAGQATEAQRTASQASARAETAEGHAAHSARSARNAQGHAAVSEAEAKRAAEEAERSKQVQAERLAHERLLHATEEERRKLRAEALKLSAIVGAAGGILSMQPLPFADNFILAPMQIWLVVRIGQAYGQSVGQDAALKLIGTLGFGFAAQHATVAMYKFVPGLNFGLGPFTVFGFTVLLGAVAAVFYERGQMPDKAEQKAVLKGVVALLKDRAFAAEIKDLGSAVAAEFKARGYKTRPDDLKAVFDTASERARPIGERLERELFGKKPPQA